MATASSASSAADAQGREVVVGYWQDADVKTSWPLGAGRRAAWNDCAGQNRPVRRQHAGSRRHRRRQGRGADPIRLSVNGYGVGDLVQHVSEVLRRRRWTELSASTTGTYAVAADVAPGGRTRGLRYAARIELGLRAFLDSGGFRAFTDHFEDLHVSRSCRGWPCRG